MNKVTKRLAAIGAAMTMAVSMMSIGASASSSGSYYCIWGKILIPLILTA